MVDLSKVTKEDAERALERVRHGRELTDAERVVARAERAAGARGVEDVDAVYTSFLDSERQKRSRDARKGGTNAWKRDRRGDDADREAYLLRLLERVMRVHERPARGWNPTNLATKVREELRPSEREERSYGVTTIRTKVIPALIRKGKLHLSKD